MWWPYLDEVVLSLASGFPVWEKPDIVAVCTNTKYRADLTCLAVEYGAP